MCRMAIFGNLGNLGNLKDKIIYCKTIRKMKTSELLKSKISLYKRVNETKSVTISLDDWLHKVTPAAKKCINDIRWENYIDPKGAKAMKTANLPCVTISGLFEGERKADKVTAMNPIICVDIDEIPDGMTLDELKKKVFDLPYVFYVSLSARGNGIFALIYYNTENDFLRTFWALDKDFRDMGIKIDRACKDICRLRFVSWDESPLEKDEVEMYDDYYVAEFDDPKFYKEEKVKRETSQYIDDWFTYKTVKYLIGKCGYRADEYNDWLMDGFRLATLGDGGHALFMYLSRMSAGFNEGAAERKWNECVRTTTMTKESLAYYYAEAKKRIGPDWAAVIKKS